MLSLFQDVKAILKCKIMLHDHGIVSVSYILIDSGKVSVFFSELCLQFLSNVARCLMINLSKTSLYNQDIGHPK